MKTIYTSKNADEILRIWKKIHKDYTKEFLLLNKESEALQNVFYQLKPGVRVRISFYDGSVREGIVINDPVRDRFARMVDEGGIYIMETTQPVRKMEIEVG